VLTSAEQKSNAPAKQLKFWVRMVIFPQKA